MSNEPTTTETITYPKPTPQTPPALVKKIGKTTQIDVDKTRENTLCMPQFLEKNCKVALCFLNRGGIMAEGP